MFGGDSFKHTSQNLASLSNASNIGKSQGFDTLKQELGATDAKAAFVNASDVQTQAQGKGQILRDKEATEMAKSSLRNEYDMSNMDELNEKIRRANVNYEQNLENNKQFAREQMRNTGSFGTRLAATVGLYEEKEFQRQLSQVNAEMGTREDFENHVSGLKSQYQGLQTQHVQKGMQGFNSSSSQADILAKSESMQFVQTAASVSAMTSQGGMAAGSIASGGGTLTSAGHSAIGIQAAERTGSIMAANNLYNNSAAISNILTDAGASQAQIASVLSARNPVERANRMQAVISSHNLRGSVNGRSFTLPLVQMDNIAEALIVVLMYMVAIELIWEMQVRQQVMQQAVSLV